ncbi:hypothetical protein [Actinoallomurus sp. NPDC050550]|uniref:hypothetical protein n=1 Tax=Actinoallomurus sp. NPDC050550 TaxID=3154937 RepID=UPI00340B85DA
MKVTRETRLMKANAELDAAVDKLVALGYVRNAAESLEMAERSEGSAKDVWQKKRQDTKDAKHAWRALAMQQKWWGKAWHKLTSAFKH